MEILGIMGGIFVILAILGIFALLGWAIETPGEGNSPPSASSPHPEEETVGERWTQVVTTAPVVLDTDPILNDLEFTRQTVEEQADEATLEVLHNIEETFRRQ
jgi:hypothetical protein